MKCFGKQINLITQDTKGRKLSHDRKNRFVAKEKFFSIGRMKNSCALLLEIILELFAYIPGSQGNFGERISVNPKSDWIVIII